MAKAEPSRDEQQMGMVSALQALEDNGYALPGPALAARSSPSSHTTGFQPSRATEVGGISTGKPALFFGRSREALADFSEQFPSARRVAAPLARHKAGFRLALGDDVRDKVVKQPLDARAGGPRRAKQGLVPGIVTTIGDGFHFTILRCCAGVTTRGEANLRNDITGDASQGEG